MQNVVSGCTCLVNQKCINAALPFPSEAIMHDWWLALVAARLGEISYLDESTICYRQHDHNVVGAKSFPQILRDRLFTKGLARSTVQNVNRSFQQLSACNLHFPRPVKYSILYLRVYSILTLPFVYYPQHF